jgi:hypothetical protein
LPPVLDRKAEVGEDVDLGLLDDLDQLRIALLKERQMRSMVSCALAWSGCAKTVRRVAATICWATLGTVAIALRMKWTRQRCQVAPTKTWAPPA